MNQARAIQRGEGQPDGRWLLDALADADAAIVLGGLGCRFAVREIYDQVELGAGEDAAVEKY